MHVATIPAGTTLVAALEQEVSTAAGHTVRVHLDAPVTIAYHPRSERRDAD